MVSRRAKAIAGMLMLGVASLSLDLVPAEAGRGNTTDVAALQKWAAGRGHATIIGRVMRDDGMPVAGIPVVVRAQYKGALDQSFRAYNLSPNITVNGLPSNIKRMFDRTVFTRTDGTFRVAGLTTARYNFSAKTQATTRGLLLPSAWVAANSPIIEAREGSTTRSPDIKMTQGGLLETRVVDAQGKPLSGISVYAQPWRARDASLLSLAFTNPKGVAVFRVPAGAVRLFLGTDVVRGLRLVKANGVLYKTPPWRVSVDGKLARGISYTNVKIARNKRHRVVFQLRPSITNKVAKSTTPKHAS